MDVGLDLRDAEPVTLDPDVTKLDVPTGLARGLPGRAYYDRAFFEAERKRIFAPGWVGVGFASDIPEVGDIKPVTLAGWELLLVRDEEGMVRCFHNICRHRGMKLAKEAGNVRNIRCSYHCWTYGLSGSLQATPSIDGIARNSSECFDYSELGLIAVRCGEYRDVIFVNIDGKARDLHDYLKPVRDRLDETYDFSLVRRSATGRGSRDYDLNWKVVIEGGIEDYHLPFVHRSLAHSPDYSAEDGGEVYAGFSSRRSFESAQSRYSSTGGGRNLVADISNDRREQSRRDVDIVLVPGHDDHVDVQSSRGLPGHSGRAGANPLQLPVLLHRRCSYISALSEA